MSKLNSILMQGHVITSSKFHGQINFFTTMFTDYIIKIWQKCDEKGFCKTLKTYHFLRMCDYHKWDKILQAENITDPERYSILEFLPRFLL